MLNYQMTESFWLPITIVSVTLIEILVYILVVDYEEVLLQESCGGVGKTKLFMQGIFEAYYFLISNIKVLP
jgi:uncharacterized membrane protein